MRFPKRTKYKKYHKGRIHGEEHRCNILHFGSYGLIALDPARITARQIEACRRAINRKIKKVGQLWIRIFPDIPVTSKPTEVRMGKGKGSVDYWCCRVKPGRILFELSDVSIDLAKSAFKSASSKLPIKTKLIVKNVSIKNEK